MSITNKNLKCKWIPFMSNPPEGVIQIGQPSLSQPARPPGKYLVSTSGGL